jgi:hypothetical protein
MMWQHAVLLPDKKNEWAWAQESFAGLPAIVRVLVALCRAGIKNVTFPIVRWLAECEVSPNLITWIGFCIGLLGSVFIATGT